MTIEEALILILAFLGVFIVGLIFSWNIGDTLILGLSIMFLVAFILNYITNKQAEKDEKLKEAE